MGLAEYLPIRFPVTIIFLGRRFLKRGALFCALLDEDVGVGSAA